MGIVIDKEIELLFLVLKFMRGVVEDLFLNLVYFKVMNCREKLNGFF